MIPYYAGSRFSVYSIMLGEFENEHSYLDQVKLLAVDHDPNVNVALAPEGQILTYTNPSLTLRKRQNNIQTTPKRSELCRTTAKPTNTHILPNTQHRQSKNLHHLPRRTLPNYKITPFFPFHFVNLQFQPLSIFEP